jgi:hypothetical protein
MLGFVVGWFVFGFIVGQFVFGVYCWMVRVCRCLLSLLGMYGCIVIASPSAIYSPSICPGKVASEPLDIHPEFFHLIFVVFVGKPYQTSPA